MIKFKLVKNTDQSAVVEVTEKNLKGYIYIYADDSGYFHWDNQEDKHIDLICSKETDTYLLSWFSKLEPLVDQTIGEILTKVRAELLFLEAVINFMKANTYESALKVVKNA